MTMTEQRPKALVLGPQDHRLREPLDVLGEPGLVNNRWTHPHLLSPVTFAPPRMP